MSDASRPPYKFDHMGLTVSDLDASVAFYRDVVGMSPISRSEPRRHGEWFEILTEHRGSVVQTAHLVLGAFKLQLVQYHEAGMGELALEHAAVGCPHLCIAVDDVGARHGLASDRAELRATPIVRVLDGPARSFYVRDPDGVPVELIQHGEPEPT